MSAPGVSAPTRRGWRRGLSAAVMAGVVAVVVLASAGQGAAAPSAVVNGCNQAAPAAGCQGIVTGLPATSSQVTVHGYGQYSNLAITVNQTKNLVNQAVSVSWTGGAPTFSNPANGEFDSTYNGNYLQIFQCWGDPQTSDPSGAGSGPLPTQCEYGGESDTPTSSYPIQNVGFEYSRVLSEPGWDGYDQLKDTPGVYLDKSTGFLVEPFQPVNGAAVDQQANYNYLANPFKPQDFWLNPDFSFTNTNEIDFARTYANGTGTQLFQMDTGLEASGLGCGQNVQKTGGGSTTPQCWLVVVPRSTPTAENPANVNDVSSVVTSAMTPEAWSHRIAIPLQFNPVGSSCPLNGPTQGIEGAELAAPAVAAWQPSLCDLPGNTSFNYTQDDDDLARQNLSQPQYGSVGMSVFSDPFAKGVTTKDPVVYAPLTLSGVVVAFNIERVPIVEDSGNLQPQEDALSGDRLAHIYLTPLMAARLLTESYKDQLQGVRNDISPKYSWIQDNPDSVFDDPQFLQYNPEFSQLSSQYQTDAGTLLVEEGSSDATLELWKWVLSDPQAVAWLDGSQDSQMQVNPYYKIPAADAPVPNDFPKSDPYCLTTTSTVYGPPPAPARPLCVLDWSPYELSMLAAAEGAATANDGAKTTFQPANTPDTAWTSNGPQITGNYFIMSVTSSASAHQFGLQAASLSPAGDDTDPSFVEPDGASFLAGEKAMKPSSTPGVVVTDPSAGGGAYPLTMLTYAAAMPKTLDATSRKNYSAFLRYAVGPGQVSGVLPGQLPAGYQTLPSSLISQTLAAAKAIADGTTVTTPPPGTTATSTSSTTSDNSFAGSYGSGSGSENNSLPASSGGGAAHHHKSHQTIGPSALSAIRSLFFPIGFMRWILPLLLLVGLCAAAGAYLANLGRQRALPEGFEDSDEMDEDLAPEDDVP